MLEEEKGQLVTTPWNTRIVDLKNTKMEIALGVVYLIDIQPARKMLLTSEPENQGDIWRIQLKNESMDDLVTNDLSDTDDVASCVLAYDATISKLRSPSD